MMSTKSSHYLLADQDSYELSEKSKRLKVRKQRKHKRTVKRIDFVLASRNEVNDDHDIKREIYFSNLRKKRLKISDPIQSQDGKTNFWQVYAPLEIICDLAEDLNVQLPTQPNDIVVHVWYEKLLQEVKDWWKDRDPFMIHDSFFRTPKSFFADTFDKNRMKEFYYGKEPQRLFTQTERSRLVCFLLESIPFDHDKPTQIGKSTLVNLGVFTAAYPCHDGPFLPDDNKPCKNDRQKLNAEWSTFNKIFKYQPLDAIMDYFGVKVAFYFAWIGFYTTYLVPASLIGVLCFLYGGISNIWFEPLKEICSPKNVSQYYMCPLCDRLCSYFYLKDFSCVYARVTHLFDNDSTAFFAVFMSIWSVVYLEYWKRHQWSLAYKWHTMHFSEEEVIRPQFRARTKKLKPNPVTGKYEPSMSRRDYLMKVTGEFSVVVFFIFLVIAALIGVILYRAVIYGVLASSGGKLRANSRIVVTGTAATINLVSINILKYIYKHLAVLLTDWENPRTRTAYEKSFTIKMFWFQFCNTYASVFYVAFFKSEHFVGYPTKYKRFGSNNYRLEGCSIQGCFLELCLQLIILMVGQQLFGNIVELLLPYLIKKYKSWKNEIKNSKDVPVWEADYQLVELDELSLFWEYQEVALQYGFVTMFVAAFPLAPLVALITNLVEIRIDAINMIRTMRRPVAYKSEGIGVWYDILATLTTFGVLVNGFVLSITSEFIPRLVYKHQFSVDGTLKGYLNWSLSVYNISDFDSNERPENPVLHVPVQQTFCRHPGFHEPFYPYKFNIIHWELMAIRLLFAFLFQWLVTMATRTLAWIIPDMPRTLDLKIKREEYLAQEALRKYKITIGKRRPEKESSGSEADNEDDVISAMHQKKKEDLCNSQTRISPDKKCDGLKNAADIFGDESEALIHSHVTTTRNKESKKQEKFTNEYLNQML